MSIFSTGVGQDPDLSYVQALKEGKSLALNQIMEKYKEPLFRFIYRYVDNHEDAADILQETFVRVYFKIKLFRPKARFVTWLYQIATNLCRDHARKSHRRPPIQELATNDARQDERAIEKLSGGSWNDYSKYQTEERYQTKEEMVLLDQAIDSLPHDLKTALIFVSLEGKSYVEAASYLKTTEKTIETRIYRAKKILEQNLKGYFTSQ